MRLATCVAVGGHLLFLIVLALGPPMPMTPEYRDKAIRDSKESAAAFLEDLAYFRVVLDRVEPSRGELRRLTGSVRRLLIDRDLITVASPRLERQFLVNTNDVNPIIKAMTDVPGTLYFNGGATVFGMDARQVKFFKKGSITEPEKGSLDAMITLNLDGFLNQRVLCLNGEFVTRRSAIKYIAYTAAGIHAGDPRTQTDQKAEPILKEIRRRALCTKTGYQIDPTPMLFGTKPDQDHPFMYSPDAIDVVLLELLATLHYLVRSEDTKELEAMVRKELGA